MDDDVVVAVDNEGEGVTEGEGNGTFEVFMGFVGFEMVSVFTGMPFTSSVFLFFIGEFCDDDDDCVCCEGFEDDNEFEEVKEGEELDDDDKREDDCCCCCCCCCDGDCDDGIGEDDCDGDDTVVLCC